MVVLELEMRVLGLTPLMFEPAWALAQQRQTLLAPMQAVVAHLAVHLMLGRMAAEQTSGLATTLWALWGTKASLLPWTSDPASQQCMASALVALGA